MSKTLDESIAKFQILKGKLRAFASKQTQIPSTIDPDHLFRTHNSFKQVQAKQKIKSIDKQYLQQTERKKGNKIMLQDRKKPEKIQTSQLLIKKQETLAEINELLFKKQKVLEDIEKLLEYQSKNSQIVFQNGLILSHRKEGVKAPDLYKIRTEKRMKQKQGYQ